MRKIIALALLVGCGGGGNGAKVQFSASGEVLALGGYGFPPATADAPAFVDGWEIHFTKFLTTIDKIKLYANPDTSPTDQSQVGPLVAEVDGPFAIDLHVDIAGKFDASRMDRANARHVLHLLHGDAEHIPEVA